MIIAKNYILMDLNMKCSCLKETRPHAGNMISKYALCI